MTITTKQQEPIETLRGELASAGIATIAKTAKTAKRAALGEAAMDTTLFGGCVAEDAASLAEGADTAWQIGGGVFLTAVNGLLFSGLLLAGRREIKSIEAKIIRRIERINQKLPDSEKLPIPNFGQSLVVSTPGKTAKTDKISAIASGTSVAAIADGFAAKPFSFMVNIIGVLIYPIAFVCAGIAYYFADRRAKRYEKLQEVAKKLKEVEETIDDAAAQKTSADDTDRKRFEVFDENWDRLVAYHKSILDLEKTSKKEKLAAFAIAGVFALITGATIYAVLASIAATSALGVVTASPLLATIFSAAVTAAAFIMVVCPPVVLFTAIAAAALCVGRMIYKNIVGKISTATHHCMNKVRNMLGLASIDGEQHGFSAATRIRMIGAALSVVAFITMPIVGWIVGLAAAAVFGIATAASSAYISYKEAGRKNLVKKIKSLPEIGKIKNTAAQVTKVFAPANAPRSVRTALIADHVAAHVAAKESILSSQVKKTAPDYAARAKLGFFSPITPRSPAAEDPEYTGRKFALGY